ncbi:hypothetical protein BHE74_00034411 [Ensete ventricosum]|nr:hypothetical protein GW17_00022139 [Ensete ventricosum]RWW58707.1 hypothetical protein BHE74_00034411 [Ensete ventricosum]
MSTANPLEMGEDSAAAIYWQGREGGREGGKGRSGIEVGWAICPSGHADRLTPSAAAVRLLSTRFASPCSVRDPALKRRRDGRSHDLCPSFLEPGKAQAEDGDEARGGG